jgi:hypothetical protein
MRILPILCLIAALARTSGAADFYKLPGIKMLDKNLYRSARVIIETRSCHHLPIGEEALLKYEAPGECQIIWEDRSTCNVESVIALD